MSILAGKGKIKLDGQKGLTKDKPILNIEAPDTIYVPLVLGAAIDYDVLVAAGDHVCVGTKLAVKKDTGLPIYSPVSGTVKGIVKRMHASKRPQNHIEIENDHQDETVKVMDIADPEALSKEELVDAFVELGIVGLGGSGFPTFRKYKNVKGINTIIINGVECEPFLTSDHLAMKRDIKALFDGVHFMIKAADAKDAVIAIKEHKPDLWELLVEEAKNWPNIKPVQVPDRYPMGWERVLIKQITKKDYERLPSEIGVIVNNSSTAIAYSKGLREGKAITKRVITVSGNGIKNPQNVETVIGTPVSYVIEKIGGYIDEDCDGFILGGGPMMGQSVSNDQFVTYINCNGLTVMKKEEVKAIPCLKCGMCTEHCPMHLQPVRIMQSEKAANVEMLGKLEANLCVECGMCTYVCPSKIEVTDMVAKGKRRYNLAMAKKR